MKRISPFLLILSFLFLLSSAFRGSNDEFKIVKENGIPVALNPDHPIPLKSSPKDITFCVPVNYTQIILTYPTIQVADKTSLALLSDILKHI